MSPVAAASILDPAPFREWCNSLLAPKPEEWTHTLGELAGKATADVLAVRLGIDGRRLYAWRFENRHLDRDMVEDALHRAGYALDDVYPDLDLGGVRERNRGGVLPGTTGRLRDPHLEVLHRLHIERGMSIREMARRLWRGLGYASEDAADFAIRKGWKRLRLEVRRRPSISDAVGRCKGRKSTYPEKGRLCRERAMVDSEFCREHDPARRNEVLRHLRKAQTAARGVA